MTSLSRCPTCGRVESTWSRGAIIDAIGAWNSAHGQPPLSNDWQRSGHGHPTSHYVRKIFGTFAAAVRAAGLEPRHRAHLAKPWTRAAVKQAVYEWVYEHGRVPRAEEWQRCDPLNRRPTASNVCRLFGNWGEAIRQSGYKPARDTGIRPRERTAAGTYARQAVLA